VREIKFRYVIEFVWRMKSGEPINKKIKTKILTIEQIENDALDGWLRFELGVGYGTCKVLARQQYTGLKDSEGNEIYEGDIIRESHHAGNSEFDIANCVVIYNCGSFVYDFCQLNNGRLGKYTMYSRQSDHYRRHIIIGNLYQSSELLNEPQNKTIGID